MDLGLAGRVAIVTGASKGIGLAITRVLADEGVTVVAGARDASAELDALTRSGKVTYVAADLSEPDGAAHLVDAAAGRGRLDILVNNVGAVAPRLDGFMRHRRAVDARRTRSTSWLRCAPPGPPCR